MDCMHRITMRKLARGTFVSGQAQQIFFCLGAGARAVCSALPEFQSQPMT